MRCQWIKCGEKIKRRENKSWRWVITTCREKLSTVVEKMTSSILNGDIMVQKEVFWNIREHLYFVYYPIISYQSLKIYRDERMNIVNISRTY